VQKEKAMLSMKEFLKNEVRPAYGCTEPGAVALAVARACEELEGDPITSVKVEVSSSIYKNGLDVGIPGCDGARGNPMAAALAVRCGHSKYGLEVLKDVTRDDVEAAIEWVEDKKVEVLHNPDRKGVYVHAEVRSEKHVAVCVIEHEHSRITEVMRDGVITGGSNSSTSKPGEPANSEGVPASGSAPTVPDIISKMSYTELLSLIEQIDDEDIEFLMEGARINREMAEYGLNNRGYCGLGFGVGLNELIQEGRISEDLGNIIRYQCYSASDARMSGALLPVMSSAGSGNHGITAVLPVLVLGEKLGKSRDEIACAIAVSHLSTSFVKSRLGRLSSVCGCVVAAGAGAAAGMVWLMGGREEQAGAAMQIVLADTAGMVCDGAKESCALKVGIGGVEAYTAALLAMNGRVVSRSQGIVDDTLEKTVENIAQLSSEGMRSADRVIIEICEARANENPSEPSVK
jgi:L-cysteine desulfidase